MTYYNVRPCKRAVNHSCNATSMNVDFKRSLRATYEAYARARTPMILYGRIPDKAHERSDNAADMCV